MTPLPLEPMGPQVFYGNILQDVGLTVAAEAAVRAADPGDPA